MPLKAAFHEGIRNYMKDKTRRDYLFDALEVLESTDPYLPITLSDGEELKIPFMDVYCQSFRDDLVRFEDRASAALAWQDFCNDRLIYKFIQVREEPYPDDRIKENQAILDDMIDHYPELGIVNAEFWGGKNDSDGIIVFRESFIRNFPGRTNAKKEKPELINGIKKKFPLEVGYCMPYQLEYHLLFERSVARFPYGSDFIVFIENIAPHPLEQTT